MHESSHTPAASLRVALLALPLFASACASVSAPALPPAKAGASLDRPAPRLMPKEAECLSFFVGEWDVEVFGPDGNPAYRAHTHARPVLDGHALQDDWRALDVAGNVMFRGTTLRCYLPSTGRWAIHWVMADVPGYTYLDAEWIDGELRATGHGVDPQGEFLERLTYYDVTGVSYSLIIERSYDGGETYRTTTDLRATKRGA